MNKDYPLELFFWQWSAVATTPPKFCSSFSPILSFFFASTFSRLILKFVSTSKLSVDPTTRTFDFTADRL